MRWEYLIVVFQDCEHQANEGRLNELGSQGWELVSLLMNRLGQQFVYLKRSKI